MRLVNTQQGPALTIHTERPRNYAYSPGDWIKGKVSRLEKIMVLDAELTIQFNGMSAVATNAFTRGFNVKRLSGQSEMLSCSRFDFFTDGQHETWQRLHAGPMRVDGGPNDLVTWDFCIQIPYTTGIDTRDPEYQMRPSYLSLEPGQVRQHHLPATCEPVDVNAQVAYYLSAQLTYTDYGRKQYDTATFEILVKSGMRADLISENNPKMKGWMRTVTGYSLVPGMSSFVSLKHKTKQFMGSSRVPKLTYEVAFSMPGTLQLNHPDYLPFLIRLRTDAKQTADILQDVPMEATIKNIRMTLVKVTEIIAGAPADWHEAKSYGIGEIPMDLGLGNIFDWASERPTMYISQTAAPFNVGKHFALRLQPDGLYSGKTRLTELRPPIEPAFVTYNLKVSYKIKYEVDIEVEGEATNITEESKVDMIAPQGEALPPLKATALRASGIGAAYDDFTPENDPAYDEGTFLAPGAWARV